MTLRYYTNGKVDRTGQTEQGKTYVDVTYTEWADALDAANAERDVLIEKYNDCASDNAHARAEAHRSKCERDAAIRDAERYRWIKGRGHGNHGPFYFNGTGEVKAEQLDAAIDAALKDAP